MAVKRALIIIVNMSEELEVVTPADTLHRAGVEVIIASLGGEKETKLSRDVVVCANMSLEEALKTGPFDAIILPGGRIASEEFVESPFVGKILKEQDKAGRLIAAICAAPKALHKYDIGLGKSITSYPTSKEKLEAGNKYVYKEDRVVVDGNIITSRGPGTALEWSMAITAYLCGQEKADEVAKIMLC